MPLALKASWEVRAGIIPGTPIPERTRCFHYTSADYETDAANAGDGEPDNIFTRLMKEATDYYQQLNNPQTLNWADITWIWY